MLCMHGNVVFKVRIVRITKLSWDYRRFDMLLYYYYNTVNGKRQGSFRDNFAFFRQKIYCLA